MQYQGKFTIGRKENIRYNLFVTGSRFLFMTVLVFVVIALMLGVTTYGQTKSIQQALIRALPMALGGAALFVVLNTVMMVFRINKAYKSKTAYEFTQDITIDGQGVHATSERGSALLAWEKIAKVAESGKTFYLFLSKTQAYVLPKYQMKNPEAEAAQVRELLRSHLDAKILKLKK